MCSPIICTQGYVQADVNDTINNRAVPFQCAPLGFSFHVIKWISYACHIKICHTLWLYSFSLSKHSKQNFPVLSCY